MSLVSNEAHSGPLVFCRLHGVERGRLLADTELCVYSANSVMEVEWWCWGGDLISLCVVFYGDPRWCWTDGPCVTAAVPRADVVYPEVKSKRGRRARRAGVGGGGGV